MKILKSVTANIIIYKSICDFLFGVLFGLDNSGVSANYKALVLSNEQSKKLIRVLSRIIINCVLAAIRAKKQLCSCN